MDATCGAEAVQPNKRLDQERLVKLVEIGFAFSAKHLRVPRKPSGQPGESKAASRWSDNQWEEMYHRLVRYERILW